MIALVTGATRGIGRRIALEIASLGYDMAIVGRDMKKLEAVKAEMEGLGRKVGTICEDLADPSSYKRVISAAASWSAPASTAPAASSEMVNVILHSESPVCSVLTPYPF